MSKARPTPRAAQPEPETAIPRASCETAGIPEHGPFTEVPGPAGAGFVALSHEVLFAAEAAPDRCDACGCGLSPDEDEASAYAVRGQGVYRWVRGDEVRFETVPLCPSCAAAIGMTALARWEIEEEEG